MTGDLTTNSQPIRDIRPCTQLRRSDMGTDTATLIERSARLKVDDLDLGLFHEQPLDSAALRCLRYMHDVEGHTMCYLRDVLVTKAHRDPDVTAFLACWSYEEHWHGDAIAKVLGAHGELAGSGRLAEVRRRLPKRDSLRPIMFSIGSTITNLTAVHMAWGAINEWTTQAGYARLAQKARNPVLSELLRRIMRQEGRHIDFYASEARRRLGASRLSQKITRIALEHFWKPVGSGVMPPGRSALPGVPPLRRRRRREGSPAHRQACGPIPGLEGLHLVEKAVTQMSREAA